MGFWEIFSSVAIPLLIGLLSMAVAVHNGNRKAEQKLDQLMACQKEMQSAIRKINGKVSLSAQIGNTGDRGSLTSQHTAMQKLLHTIDNIVAGEKQYRETRDQILNQNAPDGKAAILLTESIAIQLSRANLRITALESKLAVLQEESQRLHGDTQEGKPHTTPNHASEDR